MEGAVVALAVVVAAVEAVSEVAEASEVAGMAAREVALHAEKVVVAASVDQKAAAEDITAGARAEEADTGRVAIARVEVEVALWVDPATLRAAAKVDLAAV